MMARLGNVIYWIACGFAGLGFLIIVKDVPSLPPDDKVWAFVAAVVVALIIWAIGRAIQY
jgi:hypothetical protein